MSAGSKFVLTRGVLGWGVPIFLITAWDLFFRRTSHLRQTSHFASLAPFDLLRWLLLGGLFGVTFGGVLRDRQKDQQPGLS